MIKVSVPPRLAARSAQTHVSQYLRAHLKRASADKVTSTTKDILIPPKATGICRRAEEFVLGGRKQDRIMDLGDTGSAFGQRFGNEEPD